MKVMPSVMNFIFGILALTRCFPICTAVSPAGSTGCGKGNWCWRYCAGSSGPWCYTKHPCTGNCHEHNQCGAVTTCEKAADGWVPDCETNRLPDVEQFSINPIGSTDCIPRGPSDISRFKFKGDCWRRCEGSLGAWCYTGTAECEKESCYDRKECESNQHCPNTASTDCVKQCPERHRMRQNQSRSGVTSPALVLTIATVIVELLFVL